MQEIVYDTIREAILSGRYPPGQRLVADDLAREMNVSRMPIREALHRLEVIGLITMSPHRGAVVSELSEDEIVEIYHMRAVLDGLATRLATSKLTNADHDRLNSLLDAMTDAAQKNDLEKLLQINREFHMVIWKAANAPRLQEMLENLYDTSQRFRNLSLLLPGRLDQIGQEHRVIAEALARGDADAAERFANEHHESTAQRLLAAIEKNHDQESIK